MSGYCKYSVALLHDVVGWSAVCNFDIFVSHLLVLPYFIISVSEIVDKVKDPTEGTPVFRPLISIQLRQYTEISSLIEDCWHEEPTSRPSATKALKALHKINPQ